MLITNLFFLKLKLIVKYNKPFKVDSILYKFEERRVVFHTVHMVHKIKEKKNYKKTSTEPGKIYLTLANI